MKKSIAKIISGMALGLGALSPALLGSCGGTTKPSEIHIMSISDIRGEIPGYGDADFVRGDAWKYPGAIRVANEMQKIADKSADYLILSGGDQNSGGKFTTCTQGNTMYPVLSAMNISYSAVGNHEWDYGLEKLEKPKSGYDALGRTSRTEDNYFITANVLDQYPGGESKEWCIDESKAEFLDDYNIWQNTRVAWADPYKVVDLAGHKICLIGLTTQSTAKDGNQSVLKERSYSFIDYNASVHYAKYFLKSSNEKLYNQIESFILLTHISAEEENSWIKGEAGELAINIDTPIDAILAAHNRTNICGFCYNNKLDRKVAVCQTNDKMRTFIDLKLNFDNSKPVGKRFVSIEPKLITPSINNKTFADAHAELESIIKKPRNKVVSKVCETYATQKVISLAALTKEIGTTTDGLTYWQAGDNLKKYLYPEDFLYPGLDDVLVEQAGAFVTKSFIEGFNTYYDKAGLSSDKYKKANIAYLSNVSIECGIDPQYLKEGKVTYSQMYDLFPYDEFAIVGSLTYSQLEQVIRYMLSGKGSHSATDKYTDQFLLTPESETPITYDNLEFPFGPNQFYGFCFDVKQLEKTDKQYRKYDLVGYDKTEASEHTLKVYVPDVDTCDINDPTTWKGKEYFDAQTGNEKYITFVMNSFDFDYGNNQNLMIKDFALFNEQENPEPVRIHQFVAMDVADLFLIYLNTLSTKGVEISMSYDICKLLAHKVTE